MSPWFASDLLVQASDGDTDSSFPSSTAGSSIFIKHNASACFAWLMRELLPYQRSHLLEVVGTKSLRKTVVYQLTRMGLEDGAPCQEFAPSPMLSSD